MSVHQILVLNPGSTSTKVAVYSGEASIFLEILRHSDSELGSFVRVMDQENFRLRLIKQTLDQHGFRLSSFDAVIGRGGLMRPLSGGVYAINQAMLEDLRSCSFGTHASNLGAILAYGLAVAVRLPSFIADPVVVDELASLARFSGHPDISRRSIFHTLNHKAMARRCALELGTPYDQLNFIVAHLGGGISVGAHKQGQVVDVNNALDGEGPFSPERSGGLPLAQAVDWCFAKGATKQDIRQRIIGSGGLRAYLGTADGLEINKRIVEGDQEAQTVMQAMAYQVAKEIGAMAVVLQGRIDAIILTGGLAHDPWLMEEIQERVKFLGPIFVYPGEDEMLALAQAANRALNGLVPIKVYA